MASGREIFPQDLPPELLDNSKPEAATATSWQHMLRQWTDQALAANGVPILDQALPAFERTLIEAALQHTGGRKKEAAELLGWGRNTLTRKLQDYDMDSARDSAQGNT